MNVFLEEMCKQNSDPESETLWSMETIIMSGKIPKVKTDLKKNFFQSFSKAAITPDVIIVEGENYRAEFVNRTTNYVIPTEVEQVKNALEKLAELYPADEYGVEDIDISGGEEEIILAMEFPIEKQMYTDQSLEISISFKKILKEILSTSGLLEKINYWRLEAQCRKVRKRTDKMLFI